MVEARSVNVKNTTITTTLCSFSSFQTPADTSNIHQQRTQLTIGTNIIEREFVATPIILYFKGVYTVWIFFNLYLHVSEGVPVRKKDEILD